MEHKNKLLLIITALALSACGDPVDDIVNPDEKDPDTPTEKTDTIPTDNLNGNTLKEAAASRIEMPHIDATMFFASHYVTYENKEIMNMAVEWNASLRHADWVAFYFDATTSQDNVSRGSSWQWDPVIPSSYNAVQESDHKSDGYDKGHLCASEDRVYCTAANNQTFYYSNISPQISSFSQGFWARLEAKVQTWGRSTQKGTIDTLYVAKGGTLNHLLTNFTGTKKGSDGVYPTADSEGFSKGGLAVPSYYYMALLSVKNGQYKAIAFLVPHIEGLPTSPSAAQLQQYAVSIDQLEQETGIDFFCNLKDQTENQVEANFDTNEWTW